MKAKNINNKKRNTSIGRKVKRMRPALGDTVKVHIRPDGCVDCEWVNLRNGKDQIRWVSRGPEFTIQFADSPFRDGQGGKKLNFTVPAGGSVDSGLPNSDTIGDYEYTIASKALAMSADPGLSVTP